MSGAHSPIGPSAASRWVECPGSIALCKLYPETGSNEAAAEGTASHWAAAQILMGQPAPVPGVRCPENGVVLSVEMLDGAWSYVKTVQGAAAAQVPVPLRVEDKLTITRVHPQCFGTCDTWFYIPYACEVHVFDYKFGWTPVDPTANMQLICYAAGVLDRMAVAPDALKHLTFVLHIVQPRPHHPLGPHREWRVTALELLPYIDRLRAAAAEAMTPTARVCSGAHCKYCRARHTCPALGTAVMQCVDYICQGQPDDLSLEATAVEYRTLERIELLIKARKSGHEARMIGLIENGQPVPGYIVEPGYGHATWSKPVNEILALGDMLGVGLAAEPAAITPAQARTRGLSEALIAKYSGRKVTSKKLVAVETSKAALAFNAAPAAPVS